MPSRLATRKTCVSTASVGSPKAVLRTTLAVLRPTPGSASSAARSCGVSPPCCSRIARDSAMTCRAFDAIEADRLDPLGERLFAERRHLFRRVGDREQRPGRLVDPGVGRLRREHHRHQKRERIDGFELALRLGLGRREPFEHGFSQRRPLLPRHLSHGVVIGRCRAVRQAEAAGRDVRVLPCGDATRIMRHGPGPLPGGPSTRRKLGGDLDEDCQTRISAGGRALRTPCAAGGGSGRPEQGRDRRSSTTCRVPTPT